MCIGNSLRLMVGPIIQATGRTNSEDGSRIGKQFGIYLFVQGAYLFFCAADGNV